LLEVSNITDNINRIWQPHYWIANQLAGAVPSDFSAAVNVNNGSAIGWALGVFGSLAGGVGALVLKQNTGVAADARYNFLVDRALKSEGVQVWDKLWVKPRVEKFRHLFSLGVIPSL
jgi:hypothetical protein